MENLIALAALTFMSLNVILLLISASYAPNRLLTWLLIGAAPASVYLTFYVGRHSDTALWPLELNLLLFVVMGIVGFVLEENYCQALKKSEKEQE